MKTFVYLATVATTFIALLSPQVLKAQTILAPVSPYNASPTPIFVPSLPIVKIVPTQVTPIFIYPDTNYFPGSIITNYDGGSYPIRQRRDDRQQQNAYPRALQSNCTTSIIGSPIPSPIAIDRFTGAPCR
jgi:hypothetical protein